MSSFSGQDTTKHPDSNISEESKYSGGMGVATMTRYHDSQHECRGLLFENETVACRTRFGENDNRTDAESSCTSFEDYNHNEKADKICFGLKDTEIDNSSKVFNGVTKDDFEHSKIRKHHLDGGSIKNNSKFVNGDLDREAFIAFFCRD
ncbi:uncharacterized protein ACHE_20694A [Aspergillus chevalieri]|uniref:Uncharacterized protein n=1 Tax=Aspergillus chevalieri TaxID=182096 RepID=A0A7R7ZLB6_ASPCH|nr:uncharacterized protein ACHE_20694A [Aspergillus chevalieri]BCR85236.1 hypothetical protein ACHE_20694A [Aspergillus chevalieri]